MHKVGKIHVMLISVVERLCVTNHKNGVEVYAEDVKRRPVELCRMLASGQQRYSSEPVAYFARSPHTAV